MTINKQNRILFIISRREKPSSRLRVLQYIPFLEKEGYICQVIEFRKNIFARIKALWGCRPEDIVFIQKKLLSLLELKIYKKRAKKIIFDFDDAIIFRENEEKATYHNSIICSNVIVYR